jgi:hypothetical protein
MNRQLIQSLIFLFCVACFAPAAATAAQTAEGHAAEGHEDGEKAKEAPSQPKLPGLRQVPIRKPAIPPPKPLVVDGMKAVETYCGAIAEMIVKIAELDAKETEVRDWVVKREQLLAKAAESLTSIYAKMKPEAASAQLQVMDDDTAAALLLKLKPSVASAVMGEMDPLRAARLSDLLTGATPKSDGKKS